MRRSERFDLLVVRNNGNRVIRWSLPRWALVGAVAGVVLCVALAATPRGSDRDHPRTRQGRDRLASLIPRLAEQQALIDLYQKRVGEVRAEIDSWREIHAKIWEPFGPGAGPARHTSGIGGATASSPFETEADRGTVREDLS